MPHLGQSFSFSDHDTFILGRCDRAHFILKPEKGQDRFVSRVHFLVEINPPLCRLMDPERANGTFVNGERLSNGNLKAGDVIKVGHTGLKLEIEEAQAGNEPATADFPDLHTAPTIPPGGVQAAVRSPSPSPVLVSSRECLACGKADPAPRGAFCESCRQKAAEQPQPVPGYLLMRELGRGSMGVVHLASRETDGATVAVKTIIPQVAANPRQVDRFLREASILRDLDHPNIVRFLDLGEHLGRFFFVMDFVQGDNVNQLLKQKGPLGTRNAVRMSNQLLLALRHAHAKKFVHRDIKPSNLLLGTVAGKKKVVKVADCQFGRVYQASKMSGLTLQHEVGGTVGFMAPEQITSFRDVQPAADQYATAATLYKLLTDHHIYDLPKNFAAQLAMILNDDPIPISRRRSDLPAGLGEVIHRALARDPQRRFPDVAAFRQALLPFGR